MLWRVIEHHFFRKKTGAVANASGRREPTALSFSKQRDPEWADGKFNRHNLISHAKD